MKTQFKIVVPVYNSENWIEKCLLSIKSQVHKNFQCIVFNDCSTDSTGERIEDFMKQYGDERFNIVHNSKNMKALHNLVEGYKILDTKSEPESVSIIVDGDDYLFCEYSLSLVDQVYSSTDSMLTYGSFVHWPTGETSSFSRVFPKEIIANNDYRKHPFISSHLRTYKSFLWNSIKDEDLRDFDGEYYKVAWDVAMMLPMLEMTGGKFTYIPNILYVYNRWNPISDDVINSKEQNRIAMDIKNKNKYEKI